MAHLVAVKTALVRAVGTVWPEVKVAGHGIFLSNQLLQIDFETRIKNGAFPIAVLDFRQLGAFEYGGDPGRDEGPVTVYRCVTDAEDMDTLIGKLEALRAVLWTNRRVPLVTGAMVTTYPTVEYHMDQPLQRYFWETMKPLAVGSVTIALESAEAEP